LFGVRARSVLGRQTSDEAAGSAAFTSGLLIGSDVREALAGTVNGRIAVAGAPNLTALYASALQIAGHDTVAVDGAAAFLAGAKALVETL